VPLKPIESQRLTGCEKLPCRSFVKGHGFSRTAEANEIVGALALVGCFPPISRESLSYSAASLAPEVDPFRPPDYGLGDL